MKTPSGSASSQKAVLPSTRSSGAPSAINPISAICTTRFGPTMSSAQAKTAAPSPAVTLSAIPNWMISAIDMPNVPAA